MPSSRRSKISRKPRSSSQAPELIDILAKTANQHGWRWPAFRAAATAAGLATQLDLDFPGGVAEVIVKFGQSINACLMQRIAAETNFEKYKVREKVALAVEYRLQLLHPYRPAVAALLRWSARPSHWPLALRQLYATTDVIWRLAGDTNTDFNHYTKRGLLAYVLLATTIFWLRDESKHQAATGEFLRARIAEVLQLGMKVSELKKINPLDLLRMLQRFAPAARGSA